MAFASGSNRGAAYVAETSFGVTPTTPVMQELYTTGMNLNMSAESLQSNTVTQNRQLQFLRRGTFQTGGEIPFEMIYGHYDDLLEAVMGGTWTGDVLKNGSTFRSFTFEDRFTDIGQYRLHTGQVMDTFNLSAAPGDSGAFITGSFGSMGKKMTVGSTELAVPTPPGDNVPFDTCDGVIKIDGSVVAIFNSFDLTVANNYAGNYVIGDCSVASMTPGQIMVSGTLGAYLEDAAQVDRFINETETEIDLELTDVEGNVLLFNLPKTKFTSADLDTNQQAVNQNIPFTAIYDATDDTTMSLTRTAATP